MARMIPPTIDANNPSLAEKKTFVSIRDELSDEWIALHSLGLGTHNRKAWAEIDFVLIGPSGVFCLEVKGGRISRHEGKWVFTNRHGQSNVKNESPFDQVGSASAALKNYLYDRLPNFRPCGVGYGVVTPDIPFDIRGPDILPETVYDIDDVVHPFDRYVARLGSFWKQRLTGIKGREPQPLNATLKEAVLGELRPDVDLRPSIRQRIGLVEQELLALTQEQYEVLDGLIDNERALIQGGAGTGKTLLALEEARRQAGEGKSVLVCCFNRRLAHFLRAAVADCENVEIFHLHGLMHKLVQDAELALALPKDARDEDLFAVFYPLVALDAVEKLGERGKYDVLIIDEAQDLLLDGYLDVMDALLQGGLADGSWRCFLDPKQNLFGGTSPKVLGRLLAEHPARYRLRLNCRNTRPVAMGTALLSGVDQDEECRADGPEVEYIWYRDSAHEKRLIANRLKQLLSEKVPPGQIAVLSNRRLENSSLAGGIGDLAFPLVAATDEPDEPSAVRFSTISSYKGLEAEVVLLIDVDDLEHLDALANLYVGTSRAKAVLVVFLDESVREQFNERAEDLGRRLAAAKVFD